MKLVYCLMAACMISLTASAQDGDKTERQKKKKTLSISNKGISIDTDDENTKIGVYVDGDTVTTTKVEKQFEFNFVGVDIGINTINDMTDYTSAAAQGFLNVPANVQNEQLFNLQTGKSWNVNIWPVQFKARLVRTRGQKLYVSSGVGLQMYNFRFNKDISYLNITNPEVIVDSVDFSKNKLALTYLSVPLAITAKTRIANNTWLVYGAGVTGGYRINTLTKQISSERGKVKNHDAFNFNDFNACVTGEIGIDGIFRIFASYQLTALHETALDQHPLCIGLRFGGI